MNEELLKKGWHLSDSGIDICKEGLNNISSSILMEKALDIDLRDIGAPFLSDEIQKGKIDNISGPCVLQIQKLKNVAAPKYESSSNCPVLLRLLLTDGHAYINCLQWDFWKSLNLNTPPGTKIFLKPTKIIVQSGFLLLKENQFTLLGGHVAPMVEKWELSKQFASHQRRDQGSEEGPPPWISFGKTINYDMAKIISGNFRSLEIDSKKEEKEDMAFKQQRQANIAEISRSKEGKKKVFGGGKDLSSSEITESPANYDIPQNEKYSNSNSDVRRKNESQNYKPSEKKQYFRTSDTYQERNHKNKDLAHKYSENSHYNGANSVKETVTDNNMSGKRRITPKENAFYNTPTQTFYHDSASLDNFHTSNASPRFSRVQDNYNRFGNQPFYTNSNTNTSFNPDRPVNFGTNFVYQEEKAYNPAPFQHNSQYRGRNYKRNENTFSSHTSHNCTENNFLPNASSQEKIPVGGLEFRRGGGRPFHRNEDNYQEWPRDRPPRYGQYPANKLYIPPYQKQT